MAEPRLGAADAEDALVDGDRTIPPGTARAALRHRTFRRVYFGAFGSNIGTWMQNVVLGAFAYELTGSASFVGLIVFAQLGPLLLFSLVGGVLADVFDRRRLLITVRRPAAAAVARAGLGRRVDDPITVALVGDRVPHRHRPGGVRTDLQRRCCPPSWAARTCRGPSRSTRPR